VATRTQVRVRLPGGERRGATAGEDTQASGRDGTSAHALLERLPLGVVGVDEQLTIEYANAAALACLRGAEVGDLLPEPWPVFSLRKFASRLFTETPPTRRVVEAGAGALLTLEGLPAEDGSAVLLLQNVTEREGVRRAEREWVTNAAHELRTPISAIASAVEVLQGGAKETPEERDRFLQHIERESSRLIRLAEALLLLARIQTGQVIALELVQLEPLLLDVARTIQPHDGVAVRVDCADKPSVLADPDLLRQAVLNVAANAARHTTGGAIELTAREDTAICEIEVRDTGGGIKEAEQERVFERFFRAEGSEKGGFGLGLAITQEIARAFGGRVDLDSSRDGTVVRLQLPAAKVVRA
jgi:two-component system phosphate regulon sensor histidine kinase PhoR